MSVKVEYKSMMAGPPYPPHPHGLIHNSPFSTVQFPCWSGGVPRCKLSWSHVDSAFDVWMPFCSFGPTLPCTYTYTPTHTHTSLNPYRTLAPKADPFEVSHIGNLPSTLIRLHYEATANWWRGPPDVQCDWNLYFFLRLGFQLNCNCSEPNVT